MNYLFGGSFDPITKAHLEIIDIVVNNYLNEDDKLFILPNNDSYHFGNKSLTNWQIRNEMLKKVLNKYNDKVMIIWEKEQFNGIYLTLRKLNHPVYIMGSDLLYTICKWKNPVELLSENKFLVFKRTNFAIEKVFETNELLKKYQNNFIFEEKIIANISSTDYKNTLDNNLIPEEIYDIITKYHLYERM